MLRLALCLALVAGVVDARTATPRFKRVCTRADMGRSDRGLQCGGAFFEFAPATGVGMGTACAGVAPAGARGETMTFTRATAATCLSSTSPYAATISQGFSLSSNQPRVEYAPGTSELSLLYEAQGTNNLQRSRELCTAPWVNVATCTADQATSLWGAVEAEQLSDVSGAAFQGASQPFTTGSQTKHAVGCWVQAGTIAKATLRLVGTGNSLGDCTATSTALPSSGNWLRLHCGSAAAYGVGITSVTVTIDVGTVVGDTGTIMVVSCQHEVGVADVSSDIHTAGAAATRNADIASFTTSFSTAGGLSLFSTSQFGFLQLSGNNLGTVSLRLDASNRTQLYSTSTTNQTSDVLSTSGNRSTSGAVGAFAVLTDYRIGQVYRSPGASSTNAVWRDGAQTAISAGGLTSAFTATSLQFGGLSGGAGVNEPTWTRRVCLDPDPDRCR